MATVPAALRHSPGSRVDQPAAASTKVICRPIRDSDLDAVADLLLKGFPTRSQSYWKDGLERQRRRAMPREWPRYGVLLDAGGPIVGVILMLFSAVDGPAGQTVRCNLSSWHIEPAFGAHAGTLVLHALRQKNVVYTNISPMRHTVRTIEKIGFTCYANRQFFGVPLLQPPEKRVKVHVVEADPPAGAYTHFPDRDILIEHATMNCLSLVVEAEDGLHPFVFLPFRIWSGRLPLAAQQLVFCRDVRNLARFGRDIGRLLLARRGSLFVVHDADGPVDGLVGFSRRQATGRYVRGGAAPALGDLAYTERIIFGP